MNTSANRRTLCGCGGARDGTQGEDCRADEQYMRNLKRSVRSRALQQSMMNSIKRIHPDEQLVSMRDTQLSQQRNRLSQLVPVRRRDRLQELLILEAKERLRQEGRLQAEQAALEQHAATQEAGNDICASHLSHKHLHSEDATHSMLLSSQDAQEKDDCATMNGCLGNSVDRANTASAATTPSVCSAEHNLRNVRRALREIAEMPKTSCVDSQHHARDGASHIEPQALTDEQIFRLRTIIHDQVSKAKREEEKSSARNKSGVPRMCNHCYETQVQAKHLSLAEHESTAFNETAKVIHPARHVCYGEEKHGSMMRPDGPTTAAAAAYLNNDMSSQYNPHPQGGGVVFASIPLDGRRQESLCAEPQATKRNMNRGLIRDITVPAGLERLNEERSRYYNTRHPMHNDGGASRNQSQTVINPETLPTTPSPHVLLMGQQDPASNWPPTQTRTDMPKDQRRNHTTTSSLWRTTNQQREMDARRLMEMQNALRESATRVYARGALHTKETATVSV